MEEEKDIKKETSSILHSYQRDLDNSMYTSDAPIVQKILKEGREKEAFEKEESKIVKQKVWYNIGATILIILGLGSFVFSIFHYKKLTVDTVEPISVGVFPEIKTVFVKDQTDIRALVTNIKSLDIEEGKAYLVNITNSSNLELSPSETFSFFEAKTNEPLISSFSIVRLGVINIDGKIETFIIGSTKDLEISSKELLISEKDLLESLYKALGIDLSVYTKEIGKEFVGGYTYNLPTRTLFQKDKDGLESTVLFYSRIKNDIVLFAKSKEVLKSVYETIFNQVK